MRGLPQPGRTVVMGVVNVTPDSFSDGGEWFDHEAAIRHGRQLLAEGADLIDVGGESTRPGADRPDRPKSCAGCCPVIEALAEAGAAVSVDTMRAEVAREAVRRRSDPGQRRLRRSGRRGDDRRRGRAGRPVRVHALAGALRRNAETGPATPTWWPRWSPSSRTRLERCRAAGIADDRLIVDPGLGLRQDRRAQLAAAAAHRRARRPSVGRCCSGCPARRSSAGCWATARPASAGPRARRRLARPHRSAGGPADLGRPGPHRTTSSRRRRGRATTGGALTPGAPTSPVTTSRIAARVVASGRIGSGVGR